MNETITYPDVTIYVRREAGRLVPVAVSLGGISVPVLRAALVADPNARSTGTQTICAELLFPVGGAGFVEVGGMEDVPDLGVFE